jgi:TolA-binding protein
MSILFNPSFWLAVVLWTAAVAFGGHWKGGKDADAEHQRAVAKATEQARQTEQDIRSMQDRNTLRYLDRMHQQQEKARALPPIILTEDCRVPAAVGRVLNDAQRLPDDAGTEPGIGAAAETVDSTCAAELEIAKRNYAESCIPNAEALKELQKRWNETRKLINPPEK